MDFAAMARWVTLISEGVGKHLDTDCKVLRNDLLDLDDDEDTDGRIPLGKFYAPAFASDNHFQFSESPDYLRHLGALDERNPMEPKAIVPNVLYGANNCMAAGHFRRLCCIDDCEAIKLHLEGTFLEPSVAPELLAAAVSEVSSETIAAPRNLSAPLKERLAQIGSRHGGTVPLQSRQFAQWMHFAFPNECPYPVSPSTVQAPVGEAQLVTREVMAVYVNSNSSNVTGQREADAIPWSDDEELLSDLTFSTPAGYGTSIRRVLAPVAMLGVVFASWTSFKKTTGAFGEEFPMSSKSHLV